MEEDVKASDSSAATDTPAATDTAVAADAPAAVDGATAADAASAVDPTAVADQAVAAADPGIFESLITFIQTGGDFMYPILFVFAFGVAISAERFVKLAMIRKRNRAMWDKLHPVLAEGDFDSAREMTQSDDSTISRLLSMGLARQGAVRRRDDIEIAMEESMMEIIPTLEKRIPYIGLLANIATLLGLLGTIMGLIQAFTAVANANPAEKADLLSASISVAMNTTAFGLMAAIPLLLLHAFLTSKAGEIVDSLEMASVKTLNIISESTKRKG